jgi:hypothetical protein
MTSRIKYLPFCLLVILVGCSISKNTDTISDNKYAIIKNIEDLNNVNHRDTVIVEGILKEFKPKEAGKGGNIQYFDFEIQLRKSEKIPIYNSEIIADNYLNKMVKVCGIFESEGISNGFQDMRIKRIQKILTLEILK